MRPSELQLYAILLFENIKRLFHVVDQNLEKQALKLTEISSRYEHDKQVWRGAISDLEQKVKVSHHYHMLEIH